MSAHRDPPPIDPRAEALVDQIVGRYRPLSGRRRILIALSAVATAVGVVLVLLYPPGGVQRTRPKVADKVLCSGGQPPGCIDGKIGVILIAPLAAASTPGMAASR